MKQWLKKSGFLSSVLVILGLLFCMQCALGLVGKGAVRVPRIIDAGTVKSGNKVKCAIRMQNLTPLTIQSFSEGSCGCSAIEKDTQTIFPFLYTDTNIELNTTGFRSGEARKSVKINFYTSNQSWEEVIHLKFQIE